MAFPENHLAPKYGDLVSTLEFIHNSHDCTNLNDLNSGLQSHLNRILNSKFHLVSLNHTLSSNRVNGLTLNHSESSLDDLENQIAFCQLTGKYCEKACPIKKIDGDVLEQKTPKAMQRALRKRLNKLNNNAPCRECLYNVFRWINRPETVRDLGFMRLIPEESYWSSRDLDVLNFIWPNLLQAIRVIVFKKLAKNFHNICKLLQENPIPTALLTDKFIILYSNKAFDDVFPSESQETFPDVLFDLLQKEIKHFSNSWENKITLTARVPGCATHKGFFRLNLNRMDSREPGHWILRMEPLGESEYKLDRLIQKNSLSKREKEICHLIIEGKSLKGIAFHLFISYSTTRNHLTNIYKKLGVCSLGELTAILNN